MSPNNFSKIPGAFIFIFSSMTIVFLFLDLFLKNDLLSAYFKRIILFLTLLTVVLLIYYAKRTCQGCLLSNSNTLTGMLLFISLLGMISTYTYHYYPYFLFALAAIHVDNLIAIFMGTVQENYLELQLPTTCKLEENEGKPELQICVLKEFVIPPPLASLTADPVAKNDGESKYANREIKYTSAIDNHPNILRFYGYAVTDTHVRGLISEYMPRGSLACGDALFYGTPERIVNWALQLARALAYCHEAKIVHRDIKLDNILLSEDCESIKLCDFGFARQVSHDMTRGAGTTEYIAPEVIGSSNYNFKADVWSYGMCLYVLTHQKLPFDKTQSSRLHEFREKLLKGERPAVEPRPEFNPLLYAVMEQCWQTDPAARPTMLDIVGYLDTGAALNRQPLR